MIWHVALMSRTQVSISKAVLFAGLTAKKIEYCLVKHLDSWKGSQEIPERLLGLMEKLVVCTVLLYPN